MKKILLILFTFVMMACDPVQTSEQSTAQTPKGPEKGYAEILVDYDIKYRDTKTWVEKIRVDDHDYLMFGSGVANPPTIIHSENCPCKQTTNQ